MPHLVDTHTHLYSSQFDSDRKEAIERAISNGIEKMLLPNIDSSSTSGLWQVVNAFPNNCFPMMGLHPCSVNALYKEELKHVEEELATGRYIAVGEIGIDLYWDKTYVNEQIAAFELQLEWAKELSLPVAIHCRNSFDEIFSSVKKLQDGRLKGVLHCFTGNAEQAQKCIDLGLYLGLGGVLTFKKSGVDEAIRDIPLERLVLETDSPYLAPTPHRGKRNESAYTLLIAEKLADVKGLRVEEVASITSNNAQQLFKL